jgi:copper transport protein
MKPSMWLTIALGLFSVLWVAAVSFPRIASAQGPHQHHGSPSISTAISAQELAVGIAHGATLGAVVFLVGLVAFVVLVWLPANQVEDADQGEAVSLLCRWMWVLVGLLVVAGLVELPLYAVRASGEALSLGLLEEALFDTRIGQLWILRLALGILTATAATYAAQQPRRLAYWWSAAVVVSALLLMTLTQQSHAAAEGGFLPFAADWLHLVAASLWMGGLLGFPILLLGPLRAIPIEPRLKLLSRIVPRFSKVATTAVMSLVLTGLASILLHIPNLWSLIDTPYGRALSIKLGLLIFLLALGAQNLRLRGRDPFSRLVSTELLLAIGIFVATGFLTSLPPADADQPTIEHMPNPAEDIRHPPMPGVPSATAQPKE